MRPTTRQDLLTTRNNTVAMRPRIPLTVLGGFLGAGKTTLLNHLLAGTSKPRTAVLVNDFGELGIDAKLVSTQSAHVVALANGCVCCSLADGLSTALARVLELRDRPDWIVIEASGVSLPWKIAQVGLVDPELVLDRVVVVVDAERIRVLANDRYVGDVVLAQMKRSDLLVLNKIDLVASHERPSLRQWIATRAPGTPVVEALYGKVPTSLLEHVSPHMAPSAEAADTAEHIDHGFATTTFTSEAPLDRDRLSEALSGIPLGTLRLKGFVLLADTPEQRYLLQAVGQRFEITPYSERPSARRETALTIVCDNDLNAQAVWRMLATSIVGKATAA